MASMFTQTRLPSLRHGSRTADGRRVIWRKRSGAAITQATDRARSLAPRVSHAAGDAGVRREARRASMHAGRAVVRAQRVGLARALDDKKVTRELRRTRRHAAKASKLATLPAQRHRLRTTAIVLGSAGALAGTAYRARRQVAP